jgi:hypothetical protein
MNDRIRQLAEQAGYVPIPNAEFAISLNQLFHEKFAELIVRECANLAAKMRHVYPHQAELTKETILEHFGVKE